MACSASSLRAQAKYRANKKAEKAGNSKTGGTTYTINADSHISDLTGVQLSPEQVYEINTKRARYLSNLREEISHDNGKYDEGDFLKAPNLPYKHTLAYREALDGDTKSLNRLSYKSLAEIRSVAQRQLFDERKSTEILLGRNGFEVAIGGKDKGGATIARAEETFSRYTNDINSIDDLMRKKAENYVKKKDKNK